MSDDSKACENANCGRQFYRDSKVCTTKVFATRRFCSRQCATDFRYPIESRPEQRTVELQRRRLDALTLPGEEWRAIPGKPPAYEVSSLGRVRSLPRVVVTKSGKRQPYWGRVLKAGTQEGYPTVSLASRKEFVHALVLMAFSGPRPEGYHACHGNGDPSDNRPKNLRWDTIAENNMDIIRHGRNYYLNKTRCRWGHPLVSPNLSEQPLARGLRKCLACALSRMHLKRMATLGLTGDRRAVSDAYLAEILGTGPPVDRLKRPVSLCPSTGGYDRHRRRKEEPCEGCKAARVTYQRDLKQRKQGVLRPGDAGYQERAS